jgi:hypothetical protein
MMMAEHQPPQRSELFFSEIGDAARSQWTGSPTRASKEAPLRSLGSPTATSRSSSERSFACE